MEKESMRKSTPSNTLHKNNKKSHDHRPFLLDGELSCLAHRGNKLQKNPEKSHEDTVIMTMGTESSGTVATGAVQAQLNVRRSFLRLMKMKTVRKKKTVRRNEQNTWRCKISKLTRELDEHLVCVLMGRFFFVCLVYVQIGRH